MRKIEYMLKMVVQSKAETGNDKMGLREAKCAGWSHWCHP